MAYPTGLLLLALACLVGVQCVPLSQDEVSSDLKFYYNTTTSYYNTTTSRKPFAVAKLQVYLYGDASQEVKTSTDALQDKIASLPAVSQYAISQDPANGLVLVYSLNETVAIEAGPKKQSSSATYFQYDIYASK